jgi:stage IV sporulation protein FB
MRWSIRLGTIAGIRIEVHVTFLLMLAGVALFTSKGPQDALHTSLNLVLLFACVVLHELGHALAARRYGIRTREIVLLPIGGVARLERMPERPAQEMFVAFAGPAVNVVLATIFGVFLFLQGVRPETILARATSDGLLEFLFFANLAMIVFNLVPAFPMDGGRVLRAGLAFFMPYARATRYASLVGQGFALLFAAAGIFVLKSPVLVFIALFVFVTAGEERTLVKTRTSLTGLRLRAGRRPGRPGAPRAPRPWSRRSSASRRVTRCSTPSTCCWPASRRTFRCSRTGNCSACCRATTCCAAWATRARSRRWAVSCGSTWRRSKPRCRSTWRCSA